MGDLTRSENGPCQYPGTVSNLPPLISCPIESRFINTREDARAYYAFKMVGDHPIVVQGHAVTIRFNREETHLFTDKRQPCPECDQVPRESRYAEDRCFCVVRARRMDDILPTLQHAARLLAAKIHRGIQVIGPDAPGKQRLSIVVAPEGAVWFVRTVFPMDAKAFAQACRSTRPAPWPPK